MKWQKTLLSVLLLRQRIFFNTKLNKLTNQNQPTTTMNKAATAEDFKANIIAFFKEQSGLTIAAAKAKIKSAMVIDKWGNSTNESLKGGNVTLFYCCNENYAGGKKNGYGRGWYISNKTFAYGATIKL